MKFKRFVRPFLVLPIGLAAASSAFAEIIPLAPVGGAEVDLVLPAPREVAALPTLAEKIGQYRVGKGIVVSYTGAMNYGDVERYRKHVFTTLDSPERPLTVEIFTAGDSFSVSFCSSMKKDTYYREFLKQLDEAEIGYREATPFRYRVPDRWY